MESKIYDGKNVIKRYVEFSGKNRHKKYRNRKLVGLTVKTGSKIVSRPSPSKREINSSRKDEGKLSLEDEEGPAPTMFESKVAKMCSVKSEENGNSALFRKYVCC